MTRVDSNVERVARAISVSLGEEPDKVMALTFGRVISYGIPPTSVPEVLQLHNWRRHIAEATAALEAIRGLIRDNMDQVARTEINSRFGGDGDNPRHWLDQLPGESDDSYIRRSEDEFQRHMPRYVAEMQKFVDRFFENDS